MQLLNSRERYGAVAQALHWAVAGLVILAWLSGTFDDIFPRGPARAANLFLHLTLGLAIMMAVATRLLWRLADPPPLPESSSFGAWADRAAQVTHYVFYALLIAVPLVGIAVQFARGNALPVFGLFEIASPWVADRTFSRSMKDIHEVLANVLLILAAFHAAAALVHHWLLRDRTLVRMLPARRRSR